MSIELRLDSRCVFSCFQSKIERLDGKVRATLFQCDRCSYRSLRRAEIKKHIDLHRRSTKIFFFCSFCGLNNRSRRLITRHVALFHRKENCSKTTIVARVKKFLVERRFFFEKENHFFQPSKDADFSIRQIEVRRSFLERRFNEKNSDAVRVFQCENCPQICTSIFEFQHHRSCHQTVKTRKTFSLELELFFFFSSEFKFSLRSMFVFDEFNSLHSKFTLGTNFSVSETENHFVFQRQHELLHSQSYKNSCSTIETKKLLNLRKKNKFHRKKFEPFPFFEAVRSIFYKTLPKNRRFSCPLCKTFSSNKSSSVLEHIRVRTFRHTFTSPRNIH